MNRLTVPPAHDLVRFPASTVDDMARAYRRWLLGGPSAFSNDPARNAARFAITRELPLDVLGRNVRHASRPLGKDANAEIVEALWHYHLGRTIVVRDAPNWTFDFGPSFGVRIAADVLAIENDKASLVWLQTRRGAAPSVRQLGMLQRLFLLKTKDSDYESVGLTILDLRETIEGGGRLVRSYVIGDLPIPGEDEAAAMLQTFADAHALLVAEDFARTRAEHQARRRRGPEGQGDFFR